MTRKYPPKLNQSPLCEPCFKKQLPFMTLLSRYFEGSVLVAAGYFMFGLTGLMLAISWIKTLQPVVIQ